MDISALKLSQRTEAEPSCDGSHLERSSIATSCRKNISHQNTASGIAKLPYSQCMSGIIFDKDITFQGSGMRIRKISKENEDTSENNKTEAQDITRREFLCILYICLHSIFHILFLKKIHCVFIFLPTCMTAGQEKAADLITDGCKPPCGFWELNSGPLDEQEML